MLLTSVISCCYYQLENMLLDLSKGHFAKGNDSHANINVSVTFLSYSMCDLLHLCVHPIMRNYEQQNLSTQKYIGLTL
jgi:hypothetical protein